MAKLPLLLTNRPKAKHAATEDPRAGVPAVVTKAMKKTGVLRRKPKPGANPTNSGGFP